MFNRLLAPVAALVATLVAAPAPAADCDFLPKAPVPAWVQGSAAEAGFYTGVGQSPADNASAAQSLERAKQGALRDLAGNIEVYVRNELRIQESAAGTPGDLQSSIEVESSTQTASSALLGDVQADASWLDRKACVLWTRVKITVEAVRALQSKQTEITKLKLLQAALATADDSLQSIDGREKSLEQAAALVSRIDYALAGDASGESYYRDSIERLRTTLGKVRGRFDINARDFSAAEEGLQRARREAAIADQARLSAVARERLVRVAASAPYNSAPAFWPERATLALAEFERDTGNPCEARRLLRELAQRSTDASWQSRAQQTAVPACGAEQRQVQAFRRLAWGREVQLICIYKLAATVRAWDRACADTQALFAAHGAVQVRVPAASEVRLAQWAEACRSGCAEPALGRGLTVVMYAQGGMATRKNAENPMGADHQYKGQVASYILDDGRSGFSDQYNGIGGWNPVSSEMAMDVLAIQAGRRFREKATAHYAAD